MNNPVVQWLKCLMLMLNGKPATTATKIYNVFNTWVEFDEFSGSFNLPDISSCVYFATAGWGNICYGISGAGDYYPPRSERHLSTVRAHQICKEQYENNTGVYITLFYVCDILIKQTKFHNKGR